MARHDYLRRMAGWPGLIAIAAATAGILMLAASGAATFAVQGEAESATIAGKAAASDMAGASGGKGVRFGTSSGPPPDGCPAAPGAGAGAVTKGETEYTGSGTITVRNVIFDGTHSDDLVRVNDGKVIFENVTFRGTGSGSSGHSLEVKVGGSVEVRNSVFEGKPSEDSFQTQDNGPSVVECNLFTGSPGENRIDLKTGAEVTIRSNTFVSPAAEDTIIGQNSSSPVHIINNSGVASIYFANDIHRSSIVGNGFTGNGSVWLYDAQDILIEENDIPSVKMGESSSDRRPTGIYFLNNTIGSFQFNGTSCHKTGNTGNALSQCSDGAPAWYQP